MKCGKDYSTVYIIFPIFEADDMTNGDKNVLYILAQ